MVNKTWRQIAGVLTPCVLTAGCTSVPEPPAITEAHPAHRDAQAALIGDRPSILDSMAMAVVPQTDSMDAGEMDHSHHHMSMGEEEEQPEERDDSEDNGHSDHGDGDES